MTCLIIFNIHFLCQNPAWFSILRTSYVENLHLYAHYVNLTGAFRHKDCIISGTQASFNLESKCLSKKYETTGQPEI